jgi:hypothetical protein
MRVFILLKIELDALKIISFYFARIEFLFTLFIKKRSFAMTRF